MQKLYAAQLIANNPSNGMPLYEGFFDCPFNELIVNHEINTSPEEKAIDLCLGAATTATCGLHI